MTERKIKVYHVELKDPAGDEPKHSYFGSAAAIFDKFGSDRLGISYRWLITRYNLPVKHYENKRCVIRCGFLQSKKKTSK
jgi:hypothetical protein